MSGSGPAHGPRSYVPADNTDIVNVSRGINLGDTFCGPDDDDERSDEVKRIIDTIVAAPRNAVAPGTLPPTYPQPAALQARPFADLFGQGGQFQIFGTNEALDSLGHALGEGLIVDLSTALSAGKAFGRSLQHARDKQVFPTAAAITRLVEAPAEQQIMSLFFEQQEIRLDNNSAVGSTCTPPLRVGQEEIDASLAFLRVGAAAHFRGNIFSIAIITQDWRTGNLIVEHLPSRPGHAATHYVFLYRAVAARGNSYIESYYALIRRDTAPPLSIQAPPTNRQIQYRQLTHQQKLQLQALCYAGDIHFGARINDQMKNLTLNQWPPRPTPAQSAYRTGPKPAPLSPYHPDQYEYLASPEILNGEVGVPAGEWYGGLLIRLLDYAGDSNVHDCYMQYYVKFRGDHGHGVNTITQRKKQLREAGLIP